MPPKKLVLTRKNQTSSETTDDESHLVQTDNAEELDTEVEPDDDQEQDQEQDQDQDQDQDQSDNHDEDNGDDFNEPSDNLDDYDEPDDDLDDEDSSDKSNKVPEGPKVNGMVKWFNDKHGYGYITVISVGDHNNKDIFIHHNNISPAHSSYRTLHKGEYVTFHIGEAEPAYDENQNRVNTKHKNQATFVTGIDGGPLLCDHGPIKTKFQNFSGGSNNRNRRRDRYGDRKYDDRQFDDRRTDMPNSNDYGDLDDDYDQDGGDDYEYQPPSRPPPRNRNYHQPPREREYGRSSGYNRPRSRQDNFYSDRNRGSEDQVYTVGRGGRAHRRS